MAKLFLKELINYHDSSLVLFYGGGVPCYQGWHTACLGHLELKEQSDAVVLLKLAESRARELNIEFLLAPMDGNTWHKHRCVTWSRGDSPFFLEPSEPVLYWQTLYAMQFNSIADYYSTKSNYLYDQACLSLVNRFEQQGVVFSYFDSTQADAELQAIHQLSLASFVDNFLYVPIDLTEFVGMYQSILPYIISNYVLIARYQGEICGFVFALPDYNEGRKPKTLVAKTIAVRKQRQFAGLGRYLLARVLANAHADGFTSCIHAFMHESNQSLNLSRHFKTEIFRRYTLFGKHL